MAQGLDNLDFNIGVNVTGLPQIQQVQTRMARLDQTIRKSTSTYNANAVATNKWAKGALQQAGYQVGDYAVQVANGTSAMQAFGQQGSQLLGIFGPIGAVLGAGVAIVSAIAVAYERSGEAAKDFSEYVDDLSKSISLYRDASQLAIQSSDDLSEKYGDAAESARALFEAQEALRRMDASDALKATVIALQQEFGDFSGLTREAIQFAQDTVEALGDRAQYASNLSDRQLKAVLTYEDVIKELQDTLGGTQEDAFALAKELSDLAAAQGPEQVASELEDIRLLFGQIIGGIDNATEEQKALLRSLIESSIAALNLNAEIKNTEDGVDEADRNMKEFRRSIDGATNDAIKLRDAMLDVAQAGVSQDERIQILRAQISAAQRGVSTDVAAEQARVAIDLAKAGASIDQIAAAAQSAGEKAGVIENLNAELKDLTTTASNAGRSVRKVAEEVDIFGDSFDELDAIVKQVGGVIENSMEDAFMSVIDNTKNTADAFRSMARSIIAELYKVLVVQQMVGSVEKGTGIAGFIGKALGMRASGGQITSGQPYIVGEKGPELIVPSRNAHVVPNNQLGGGGGIVINQNVSFGSGVTRAEVQSMLPKMVEATKAAVLDAKRRGGAYGGAF